MGIVHSQNVCYAFYMAVLSIQKQFLPEDRLRKLGIGIVYLFGSHAEGVAGAASDIDIGVALLRPSALKHTASDLYAELYDLLTDAFDMQNFRDMDIVFLDRAPLELRFDVITHGRVLFESDAQFRLDYEERTAMLYRDFKPLLEVFNEAILERV
ncbi:MAG: DNA polymerase beta domain-containing protein [Parcubacteria group bacterium Gr01-1014_66]|nr:MAG: DNA polymerase beta domain-containing protein [Parcubacteria group bacterium Gr01-1014_66]